MQDLPRLSRGEDRRAADNPRRHQIYTGGGAHSQCRQWQGQGPDADSLFGGGGDFRPALTINAAVGELENPTAGAVGA